MYNFKIFESIKKAKQKAETLNISEKEFKTLEDIDNTKTKKYLEKLILFYIELKSIGESNILEKLKELIVLFEKYKNKLNYKDIYYYKDFYDLYRILKNFKSKKDKDIEIKKGVVKIIDNDDILFLQVYSKDAIDKYGAGSRWCLTSENEELFYEYIFDRNFNVYILIIKNKELSNKLSKFDYTSIESLDDETMELIEKYEEFSKFAIIKNERVLEIYNSSDLYVYYNQMKDFLKTVNIDDNLIKAQTVNDVALYIKHLSQSNLDYPIYLDYYEGNDLPIINNVEFNFLNITGSKTIKEIRQSIFEETLFASKSNIEKIDDVYVRDIELNNTYNLKYVNISYCYNLEIKNSSVKNIIIQDEIVHDLLLKNCENIKTIEIGDYVETVELNHITADKLIIKNYVHTINIENSNIKEIEIEDILSEINIYESIINNFKVNSYIPDDIIIENSEINFKVNNKFNDKNIENSKITVNKI